MEAETSGDTLHDVEFEASADTLADRLGEVKPKTLRETGPCKCHDTGRDKTLSDMEPRLPTTLTQNTDQDTYRHTGRS